MSFLHITSDDDKQKSIRTFNSHLVNGGKIFMLVYMEDCPPCIAARPEWKKLKNVLKVDKDVVIVDINQKFLNEIKSLTELITKKKIKEIQSFPTIMYISKKGDYIEQFQDSPVIDKKKQPQNTIDNLHKWITHVLETQKGGGVFSPKVFSSRNTRRSGLKNRRRNKNFKTQRKRIRKR
jgi:thiol-disulfide isomerase/thioredoxin